MPADALSRALNGQRGFASIELAKIAEILDVDLHWLITGQESPQRVRVAARHEFDHYSGIRGVPGFEQDEDVLSAVAHAYRQAYPDADHPSKALPGTVEGVREVLADGFVREFADRLEAALDVDVVRVPGLSTDYSVTIGGRHVIVLAAHANWFRSNFSLAHELGHLALGHHDLDNPRGNDAREGAANRFAADLLMLQSDLSGTDWETIGPRDLALFVWESGVSTGALLTRLDALRIPVGEETRGLLSGSTQRLLRRHGGDLGEKPVKRGPFTMLFDPITERMNAAAARRFPLSLQEAHGKRIANGEITPGTLAWMLDTDLDDVVIDRPERSRPSADELADMLGL
nr:ImmA/IrrE family metallo-endopeptidase [Haloactinopolyspora alba]